MKASRLKIFIDFFSLTLKALVGTVGAGIGEGRVATTLVEVPAEGDSGAIAAAPVGRLTGSSNKTTAFVVVVVVGFLPAGVDLRV